jgi:DNA modification methylase
MALQQSADVTFNGLSLSFISEKYHSEKKKPLSFDFKSAIRKILPSEKEYSTEAHYIHYYPGRIFPYIPLFMLSLNDFRDLKGPVLDPFAGSGTILLESVTNPFLKRTAIGVEKNPIGRLVSKVKCTPLNEQIVDELLIAIQKEYNRAKRAVSEISEFKNRSIWLSDKAFQRLSRLKYAIMNVCSNRDYRDFFWLCYSGTIRKVSKANPYIPPPVVLKPEKYMASPRTYRKLKRLLRDSENPDVLEKFTETTLKNKKKLAALNNFFELKNGEVFSEIIWDDAKNIMKGKLEEYGRINKESAQVLEPESVDLVLTSPPYLTAQKYIRTNRLELFCIGYDEREVESFEKGTIGTEHVSLRTKISSLDVDSIDKEVEYVSTCSNERAVQVFQYFKDMMETLAEMQRVLRKNSYAIVVVGDNRVLHKSMKTYRLLTDAAVKIGFEEIVILNDIIRTRSMLTKRNGTGGMIKNEYVIVLKKV